jgi:large subunit ribosomal protein L24
MTLARIRKGDSVEVRAGKEAGKRGVVREVRPRDGTAIVQDINISKRHFKPGRTARQAGIVDLEQPIHLSNLAPIDPKSGKATRVRMRPLGGDQKVRVSARSGEQIGKE